jgi:hypothetical protein
MALPSAACEPKCVKITADFEEEEILSTPSAFLLLEVGWSRGIDSPEDSGFPDCS